MKKRSLVTAAASVALLLGMATPAAAGGDGGRDGLKVFPPAAGPGTEVTIKANKAKCREGGEGTVASQAFEESRVLDNGKSFGDEHRDGDDHRDDGDRRDDGDHRDGGDHRGKGKRIFKPFAKAVVGNEDLEPGIFEVVAFCRDGSLLRGEFELTDDLSGAADTGLGGLATGGDSGTVSSTTAAGTAAGGAAVAGIAGYLFLMRRRANADQA